jgi:hypothetical protein
MERAASEEIRTNTEFVSSIHRQAARQYDRVAKRASIISFGKTRGKYRASHRRTNNLRVSGLLGRRTRRTFFQETCAENERPVRGDNRTGQAIWALGVDGRSRRIQPMGRDYRSHIDKSQHPRRTFKTPGDFFNFVFGNDCRKNRCAAGYFAAFAADLSDAIDG